MVTASIAKRPLALKLAGVALALAIGSQAGSAVKSPASAALPPSVEAAAGDFPALRGLCAARQATSMAGAASPTDLTAAVPTRVFDNLYYVGSKSLSSWAITTTNGIILIDALRNAEEARSVIEPSMRTLGLDPAKIRYIIVSHGHGDHYGGVRYLVERYRPRVVISEVDIWPKLQSRIPARRSALGAPTGSRYCCARRTPAPLGDTIVELPVARTHTRGTVSPIINVRDGPRRHRVMLWGAPDLISS